MSTPESSSNKSALSTITNAAGHLTRDHLDARVGKFTQQSAREIEHVLMDAERFIVRHPWQAVGIAVGTGLIIGSLFAVGATRTGQGSEKVV